MVPEDEVLLTKNCIMYFLGSIVDLMNGNLFCRLACVVFDLLCFLSPSCFSEHWNEVSYELVRPYLQVHAGHQ